MSRSAWDNPHIGGDLDGPTASLSRQTSIGISRSQDDATVGYYFQRPQSENDLQSFAGGKRWAMGDDTLVEQAKSVSDLDREFHQMNLGNDFSAKKYWEIDDGHISDGKGSIFSSNSPWSPRQSTWSSPTTDNNVAQALQLSPPGRHRPFDNMVGYVLGDPIGKNLSSLRSINEYSGESVVGESELVKTPKKTSKTSSPFEPIDKKNSSDNQSDLLCNGDDQFRVLREESPMPKNYLDEEPTPMSNQQKAVGSTPTKKIPVSHNDSFAPILSSSTSLEVPQGLGLGNVTGQLDPLSFNDFTSVAASMDSPVANQFTGMNGPLDFQSSTALMMMRQSQGLENLPASHSMYQNQPPVSMSSMANYNQQQPQQLMMPQQPPTPGGQPNQMPFMFNQNQQQFNMQQQHQQQMQQQQMQQGSANMSMVNPNQMNSSNSNQQPMFQPPFVMNNNGGQDPHSMGVSMGPVQYVQTPWGIYPANFIQQSMSTQQQNSQMSSMPQRPSSGQRTVTPGQQQSSDGNSQQMNPQMQMPPNYIDINSGYPAFVAFYDQNGQLVTMNNTRGMPGAQIRLVSPAPYMFNPNNMQQSQQGFNTSNSMNFNGNTNGPPNMNGMQQMNPMQQMNMQSMGQHMPMSSTANNMNYSQNMSMNMSNTDFGMPQRQDSFGDQSDKFRMYQNMNMSVPSGPLGLVQPPQTITPPALSGNTGLGLGSGGRLYSTAPGAEGTYRNNMVAPPSMPGNHNNTMYSRSNKEQMSGMNRSRLLEDFRSSRLPNLQLKDLSHHVVEFSQDQHGSRFIQQKLERASTLEKQMVFNEILSAAYSLMTDVFGNYVIQKFFEFGLQEQKQTLAQRLTGQVLPLALQMYGCRVIQKALESIPQDMQITIVKELDGHVLKCVKDQNGNHVVQKCIECVEPNHLQFIIDAFRGQVYTLSTHPYGCRVIQRILEHCLPSQTEAILSELHDTTDRLVLDQYGNYVIQHVLEHGKMEEKSKIVAHICGKVLQLSQHKFASNVVEKCVSHSSRAEKAVLIEEVCSTVEGGQSALYIMMKDQYANYVIQKMLDISEPNQRKILMHKIRPHIATLRKYTYGKHIIAKLEKYLMKNGGGDLGSSSPLTLPM